MKKTLDALVNPFGDLKSGSPDNLEKPKLGDELVAQAYDAYKNFNDKGYYDDLLRKIQTEVQLPRLKPSQISLFLKMIIEDTRAGDLDPGYKPGLFLTRLVRYSHKDLGFEKFEFDLQDSKFIGLFDNLVLAEKKTLNVRLNGDAGNGFGARSVGCNFYLRGSAAEYCGELAVGSIFNIGKGVESGCGNHSRFCEFNIERDAGRGLGSHSERCEFNVKGSVGECCGMDAEESIFNAGKNFSYDIGMDAKSCIFAGGKMLYIPKDAPKKGCLFVTTDKETHDGMKPYLADGNEVILV